MLQKFYRLKLVCLVIKLDFQSAVLRFTVVGDIDIFDINIILGQQRRDMGQCAGFVGNLNIDGKAALDRSAGKIGKGIPVDSCRIKEIIKLTPFFSESDSLTLCRFSI